jgi:GT2 family glycosyltransferase
MKPHNRVGVVVIGRNEGDRLVACLSSLGSLASRTVYVDSGSIDGSQGRAAAAGVQVVELDSLVPFTAARARNIGYASLLEKWGGLDYVQFVDGDCTLDAAWIDAAMALLDQRPKVALVCGRRREKYPARSIYNEMCDREWDGPTGSILESGGDFLIRTLCFSEVDGFRATLIAGEEPELCLRLREKGWEIWRLRQEMTLHDANILSFAQWWRRTVRAGHAFAEVSSLHRHSPKRIWRRNVLRALGWSAIGPLAVGASLMISPWFLSVLLAYPLQIARLAARDPSRAGFSQATFSTIGKLAEAQGVLTFYFRRLLGQRSTLIEYK